MKKVFLTVVLFAGFGLAASGQETTDEPFNPGVEGCRSFEIAISATCFEGCVSVKTPLGPRKPTASEYIEAQGLLQEWCDRSTKKPVVGIYPE